MHQLLYIMIFIGLLFPLTSAAQSPPSTDRVQIIEDQQSGEIRFVIDGVTVLTVTADGLTVRNNINYGGIITDQGTGTVDGQIEKKK